MKYLLSTLLISFYLLAQTDKNNSYEKAMKLYNDGKFHQSYVITKKLLNQPGNFSKKLLFKILKLHGTSEFRLSKLDDGEKTLKRCLQLLKEIKGKESEIWTADVLNTISNIYNLQGKFLLATKNIKQAKSIYTKKNNIKVLHTMNNLGLIYEQTFRFDLAINIYKDAIKKSHKLLGKNHKYEANFLNNLGLVYKSMGDYKKAIRFFEKATIIDKLTIGEEHPFIAANYNNLGSSFNHLRQYKKAIDYYQKALKIRKTTYSGNHAKIAVIYNNIAVTHFEQKNFKESIDYYLKAIDIYSSVYGKSHHEVIDCQISLANIYTELKEYAKAKPLYLNAIKIHTGKKDIKQKELSYAYINFSKFYKRSNQLNHALIECQNAVKTLVPGFKTNDLLAVPNKISRSVHDYSLVEALNEKGAVLISLYEQESDRELLDKSITTLKLALQVIKRIQRNYKNDISRLILYSNFESIYKNLIIAYFKLSKLTKNEKYLHQAYKFTQLTKSKILNEKLRLQNIKSSQANFIKEYKTLESIRTKLIENELQINHNKNDSLISSKKQENFALSEKYESYLKNLETKYPEYYQLKYGESFVPIHTIQERIEEQLLLDYVLTDKHLYIFIIDKKTIHVEAVPVDQGFEKDISNYLTAIKKINRTAFISTSNKLYNVLVKPIEKKIGGKSLIIIPDNQLFQVPFEALAYNNASEYHELDYLIKRNPIIYYHSTYVFKKKSKTNFKSNFIGFAPAFEKSESDPARENEEIQNNVRAYNPDSKSFNPLPYSIYEVKEIKAVMDKNNINSVLYLNHNANKENLKKTALNNRFLHLSTHGYMDQEDPDLSWLAFYGKEKNLYSLLYSKEISDLNFESDLIVLSSCESGTGQLFNGEGPLSLSTGFLYSGTNHILYSLWSVWEKQTSELMINFYKQVFKQESYSQSLQSAKLNLINNPGTANPIFWAAFVLVK